MTQHLTTWMGGVLITAMPYLAAGQTAALTCDTNADARALCNAETALTDALRRNDVGALSTIYDAEFRLTNFRGRRIDRASVLAALKSGALRFESLTTSEIELSLFGNVGIVMGIQNQVAREPGGDGSAHPQQVRFTHIYALRDGRWRLVSSQITPILK